MRSLSCKARPADLSQCAELYERYTDSTPQAVDEWTLSQAMDAVGPNEKQTQMEAHYSTFITEEDFANIAAAGLNWVRIPIAFWHAT